MILSDDSTASDPELPKKTWFMPSGVMRLSLAASSNDGGAADWKWGLKSIS